jgi:hypothetical protein
MNDHTARAGHPNSSPRTHRWGSPLPGSGSMAVCSACGAKRLSTSDDPHHPDAECSTPDSPVAHTASDYEPL